MVRATSSVLSKRPKGWRVSAFWSQASFAWWNFFLNLIFAGSVHPADIQPIDADAVLQNTVGNIFCEGRQRAFGAAIGRDERLPAMCRHALDIDNGAGNVFANHDFEGFLHQEKRGAGVDVEHAVEQLWRGVENGAAVGEGGAVHERMDFAKMGICGGHDSPAIFHLGKVCFDKMGGASFCRNLMGDGFAFGLIASTNHQAGGSSFCKKTGSFCSKPLGAARDDCNFSFHLFFMGHGVRSILCVFCFFVGQ